MNIFLACAYNYQDFAQTQENFARSHDRVTVTFRNSWYEVFCYISCQAGRQVHFISYNVCLFNVYIHPSAPP